ncbi:MAG TPA: glycosyl hydrolase, partial [Cyclobacteriaceae bacterium]|nr:glycosyl hydrolase [Cyclobacteriaceae bacterium]
MTVSVISRIRSLLFLALAWLILPACKPEIKESLDPSAFSNPPEQAKIYTWWHWMEKSITRQGITRDLEAMKGQGITGATILNIGLIEPGDYGVPKVVFGTPEWFDMYKWALTEANRLDMVIGVHNCDGWSTSGGPWITPEMSMKDLTWSKTILEGGKVIDTVLARPNHLQNFYEDIAVVACPSGEKANSFHVARPLVKINDKETGNLLFDGNPGSFERIHDESIVDITFPEAFEANKASVHLRVVNAWRELSGIKTQIQVRVSHDGYNYYPVSNIQITGVNKNFITPIPRIKTRYFRIVIKRPESIEGYVTAGIGELELLGPGESPLYDPGISDHLEKIASTKYDSERQIFSIGKTDSAVLPADPEKIVDLTKNMDKEGRISWDAPEGNWTVFRLGYTTTGVTNGPATAEGTGLECDKMDTSALNHHFASFPKKLAEASGRFKGNTFEYIFIDSWECGFQNWTKDFEVEFEKRRGYSILSWIPALCGITVKDRESTEAFFNDYRKTIADLIGERYYAHFSGLCHREGLKLHAEVIYGGSMYPPLDILNSNQYIDVPMFEFWAGQSPVTSFVEYTPSARTDFDKPVLGAIAFGQPVVAAEAYTGYAHYSESPWDLKLFGDRAFCSGINRMVLHSYVHQPSEKIPGMTLGVFASHFNRHNTWWPQVSEWFKYQARIQTVLQKGSVEADILFFTGDRFPEYGNYNSFYTLPSGYHAAQVNAGLLKSAVVKD